MKCDDELLYLGFNCSTGISFSNKTARKTKRRTIPEIKKYAKNLISTPTLIIWGEQDHVLPVENAYLFEKNIKGSKLEILPNVGHVPMEEAPKRVAEIIDSFIR